MTRNVIERTYVEFSFQSNAIDMIREHDSEIFAFWTSARCRNMEIWPIREGTASGYGSVYELDCACWELGAAFDTVSAFVHT